MKKPSPFLIVTLIIGIVAVVFYPAKTSQYEITKINFRYNDTNWNQQFREAVKDQAGEGVDYISPIPKQMPLERMQKVLRGEMTIEEAEAPYIK